MGVKAWDNKEDNPSQKPLVFYLSRNINKFTMEQFITFLSLISASYLFAEAASPVQQFKYFLNLHAEAEIRNPVHHFFVELLNCPMCVAFWVGIGFYQDFLLSCLLSVAALVVSSLISKINNGI